METTPTLITPRYRNKLRFAHLLLSLCLTSFSYGQPGTITFKNRDLDWLNSRMVELDHRQPVQVLDKTTLVQFGNWVDNVKIVGLGEDTHGTREYYQLKLQLIKYLVAEKGFTLVAIEDNLPEIGRLNELIMSGAEDRQEYQKYLSEHLQYREYFELFDWLRQYNQGAPQKVLLYGIDMQSARVAMDMISATLRQSGNRKLLQQADLLRNDIREAYLYIDREKEAPAADKKKLMIRVLHRSRSLLRTVKLKKGIIVRTSSAEQYRWLVKNLETIVDFTKFTSGIHTPIINRAVNRDMAMADNVDWILERHPGSKIVVWAHNGHVHKDLNRGEGMGYFIRKKHGSSYFSVGFLTAQGQYAAMDPQTRRQAVHSLPGLSADSWNSLFERSGKSFFYIKTDEAFHTALNYPLKVRGIGLQAADEKSQYYITKNLNYLFDAVFFMGQTTAATHLSVASGAPVEKMVR